MGTSAIRVLAVAALAAASITCADNSVGLRRAGIAAFALAPSFSQAPAGGPDIDVTRVRGVLRNGTDSSVAEAPVKGDSALLEFVGVPVTGDSTKYQLTVQAFDANNVVVFAADDEIQVKPGDNVPAAPVLDYVAPDANAATIDVTLATLQLDWAGAAPNDNSCLNRAPSTTAKTQQQLTVTGKTTGGQDVPGVRVGWTSRDTTVVTVDENGLARSRCSNKSTYVVARSFLDKADSVLVTVSAPPFSLLMSPDSTNVARGATTQLNAIVVDENGNSIAASQVTWHSSNTSRATVSSSGLVTGVTNGRVLITASSGNRTTVGVVHVVRPLAAEVLAIPQADTAAVGQIVLYYAKAVANNRIIGDAKGFEWMSDSIAVATVGATTGVVKTLKPGNASIIVSIDGKKDTVALRVEQTLPGGSIKSRILDAATDAPLAGVVVAGPSSSATTAADGSFLLGGLQPGDNITISKAGYVTVTLYDAPVFRNYVLQIPDAGLPPESTSPGTITGKVVNALNGGGISGITVKAYLGLNAAPSPKRPDAQPIATVTSNSSGIYTFSGLAAGAYTLHFSGTGYSENITLGSAIGGMTETLGNVLLPPTTAGAGLVVVLTWAQSGTNVAADLDAHVTGPKTFPDTGRFHVYNAARSYVVSSDTIAALELDDTSFGGPEVITLRASAAPGGYRYYVHNFSGSATGTSRALADSSSARVDVYQDNRVIGTFFPPAGQAGTLWKVFEFDGARLFPVNAITHQQDATVLPMIVGSDASVTADVARVLQAGSRPKNRY